MRALFVSFPAADYAASKRFYELALELRVVREIEGGPHRATNYDLGGIFLKVFEWTAEWHGSGHSGLFIETGCLDDVVQRVGAQDGVAMDIVEHEWGGRCCTIRDPFGNLFNLIDSRKKGDT